VTGRPPLRVLLGVGLIAGSTLALQVLLTRVFAAVLYYHFGFLAISLALLGVGAGAIAIYVRPGWFDRLPLERQMARFSLAYAGLLLVAIFVVVRLNYSLGDHVTFRFVVNLTVACVLCALPFLAAGVVIALAVRGYARSIGRLYAFDLAGAGLGAGLVVPVMWLLDAPTLVAALAILACVSAALFGWTAAGERRVAGVTVVAALAITVISATTALLYIDPEGKIVPVSDRWTPLNRVLGYAPIGPVDGYVVYDRNFAEVISHRRGTPLPSYARLQEGPQSVGYAMAPPGNALVIGGGGGRDILTALHTYHNVDVVELNRAIRDTVDKDLRRWSGGPYSLPGVHTKIGDGRTTVAQSDTKYDHIQIGYVDTFSASGAQAFALTENNLYTVEAFRQYFDHLKPHGILNVARPRLHNGTEALRMTVLALEALRKQGIDHPDRNVVVLLGQYSVFLRSFEYGTVLVRLEPWTGPELARIKRLAKQRDAHVAFAPGGPYVGEWAQLHRASSPSQFCHDFALDVCAPTDDKPFFFNMKRPADIGTQATTSTIGVPDPLVLLAITLGILLGLSWLAFVLPLMLVRGPTRPSGNSLVFFAAIGLGFLVLEIVLIQRFVLFLGFPTYALSVVLFALLIFTGVGSLLSTRARGAPQRTLVAALGVGCVLIASSAFGLLPLLEHLIDQPFGVRVALTVAMLAPVGLTLGMAMPIGLGRLAALYPSGVPWAWGINGIASVLASVLAVFVALNLGFTVTTLLALACYLVALADAVWGRWPGEDARRAGEASATQTRGRELDKAQV
jgi:Spermine/spermidine synthase domain